MPTTHIFGSAPRIPVNPVVERLRVHLLPPTTRPVDVTLVTLVANRYWNDRYIIATLGKMSRPTFPHLGVLRILHPRSARIIGRPARLPIDAGAFPPTSEVIDFAAGGMLSTECSCHGANRND